MGRKDDLQEKAKRLGLDDSGTVAELETRITEYENTTGQSGEPDPTDPEVEGSSVIREERDEGSKRLEDRAEAALKAAEEAGSDEKGLNIARLTSTRGQESAKKNPLGLITSEDTGFIGVDAIYQNFADERRAPMRAEEGDEAEAEQRAFDNAAALEAQSVGVGRLGYRGTRPNLEQEAQ